VVAFVVTIKPFMAKAQQSVGRYYLRPEGRSYNPIAMMWRYKPLRH